MAITTYAELQTSIGNWINRADLTDRIPEFIDLAEANFNRDLRHRDMETTTTLNTVAGTSTLSLPSDYLETRALVNQTTPKVVLEYMTVVQLDTAHAIAVSGQPYNYTIVGNNFRLGPTPDAIYNLELTYYQRIPALSDANTTNWLLTNHPDAYLFGALVEAEPYLKNDERLPVWGSKLQRSIEGLKAEASRSAFNGGPLYSRTNVTVA